MHGVRKVPTTEEQKELKERERAKKLKAFRVTTGKIFEKREKGELDDEVLELTAKILSSNPDYATLWNFRREVVLAKGEQLKDNPSALSSLFIGELELSLQALMTANPKSYGAWHHRAWTLATMDSPDYEAEIKLCNRALKEDERNFHCWDHRRFVCRKAGVSDAVELEFSDSKVAENFSNYSVWHYRSTLLPKLRPSPAGSMLPIEGSVIKHEFELAQSAFYTDPEDSSAWFYHQWLLEPRKNPLRTGGDFGEFDTADGDAVLDAFGVLSQQNRIFVVFDKAVNIVKVGLEINFRKRTSMDKDESFNFKAFWKTVDDSRASRLWISELGEMDLNGCSIVDLTLSKLGILQDEKASSMSTSYSGTLNGAQGCLVKVRLLSQTKLPDFLKEILEKEIEMSEQLVEIEPGKWPCFSLIHAMNLLDFEGYKDKIMGHFDEIERLDPKRAQYYRDLRSRFVVLHELDLFFNNYSTESRIGSGENYDECLNLSGRGLSIIPMPLEMIGVKRLDLSRNNLSSVRELQYLVTLKDLILDDNRALATLEGLGSCQSLEKLSIRGCDLLTDFEHFHDLEGKGSSGLKLLIVGKNFSLELIAALKESLSNCEIERETA